MSDYNWEEILDGEGAIIGFEKVPVESDVDKENRLTVVKSKISEDKENCMAMKAKFEEELAKFLTDISPSDAKDLYAANIQSVIDKCSADIVDYDAAITKVEAEISNIFEEMEEIEPPTPDPTPDPEEGEE